MATAAGTLSEPSVLAHTKQRLFPDDEPNAYAVVDTQFSTDRWLSDVPIDPSIHETLAPFNHVRVGDGYPDLVGVRSVDAELLAVDRFDTTPPLIAVEAKGATETGAVDTERGIVQAHNRLGEANVAYLTAPSVSITASDRTLARELNVGVLGVSEAGAVEVLEAPRLVGNRTTSEAAAIRFQASAQGVADNSFGLNHPKNYLGYPLAVHAAGETEAVLSSYRVVGATESARRGAAFLGLIRDRPGRTELTPLGREVVRFAIRRYGSVESALAEFETWYRSRKRFCDLAPAWGELARRVLFSYPATELLVEELQRMHDDGFAEPTLAAFVEYLHELHPTFTVELFVNGSEAARRRVLGADGDLRRSALRDGTVYHSPTVFQLKAILYHVGFLTERGSEPHRLDPTTDVWALREPIA
ncbi:MAG: hypothetical protein ACQETB_09935 [Halobacteriota archaeon]